MKTPGGGPGFGIASMHNDDVNSRGLSVSASLYFPFSSSFGHIHVGQRCKIRPYGTFIKAVEIALQILAVLRYCNNMTTDAHARISQAVFVAL